MSSLPPAAVRPLPLPALGPWTIAGESGALLRALRVIASEPPPLRLPGQHAERDIDDSESAESWSDRRQFPRRESGCVVSVCRLESGAPFTSQQLDWQLHATPLKGMLIDISLVGAAFLLPEPLESGDAVALRLSSRYVDRIVEAEADILRTTRVSNWFKIVGRFRQTLAFEDVRDFGRAISGMDLV